MYKRRLVQSGRGMIGRGIGGLFRSLVKVIRPVAGTLTKAAKPALKKLVKSKIVRDVGRDTLRTGVQTAVDTLNDLADGKKPSATKVKSNLKQLGQKSLKTANKKPSDTLLDPPAIKKRKYIRKNPKKKIKKSIYDQE